MQDKGHLKYTIQGKFNKTKYSRYGYIPIFKDNLYST